MKVVGIGALPPYSAPGPSPHVLPLLSLPLSNSLPPPPPPSHTQRVASNWGDPTTSLELQRRLSIAFVGLVAVLPLSLARSIAHLSKASVVSLCAVAWIVLAVFIRSLQGAAPPPAGSPQADVALANNRVFGAIGLVGFAFVCHHNSFLIFQTLPVGGVGGVEWGGWVGGWVYVVVCGGWGVGAAAVAVCGCRVGLSVTQCALAPSLSPPPEPLRCCGRSFGFRCLYATPREMGWCSVCWAAPAVPSALPHPAATPCVRFPLTPLNPP
jgi:hypothetical protein